MNTNIISRKAQGIFSALTNNYVSVMYPDADLTDEELEKKLRFTLQNRLGLWMAFKTNRSYKDFLDIGKINDSRLAEIALETLIDPQCSSENVRDWWHAGGRTWSFDHREKVKQRVNDDKVAYVIRDDEKGMFVNLSKQGDISYVKNPVNHIAHDVHSPCTCGFSLMTVYEGMTGSKVRVFKMNRTALNKDNISTSGFSKELVNSFRTSEIHEPPQNKSSKK
ncbi:hypothetical protein NVP2275O_358 [Vibrio phage 2.275.O._10N.286.54.E11]|nr:hypothetical protein NVP2275O_358 [Vibrio phage 2.275.O._10N.286.54.E11]